MTFERHYSEVTNVQKTVLKIIQFPVLIEKGCPVDGLNVLLNTETFFIQ